MKPTFDGLVERHLHLVYFFAYRLLGLGDEAEDVAHDTFVRALERYDRFVYRSEGELKCWLLAICRNVATDLKRRPFCVSFNAEPVDGEMLKDDRAVDPEVDLLEREIAGERTEAVRREIGRLELADRELLRLRIDEAMTFEEIAGAVGGSIGAMKMRYYRTLRRLREAMA